MTVARSIAARLVDSLFLACFGAVAIVTDMGVDYAVREAANAMSVAPPSFVVSVAHGTLWATAVLSFMQLSTRALFAFIDEFLEQCRRIAHEHHRGSS